MIILNDMPGQLSNRLWSIAPFVAFCLRQRRRLMVPLFGDYAALFPDLNRRRGVRFVRRHGSTYLRVVRRALRTLRSLPGWLRRALRLRVDVANWGQEAWSEEVLRARWSLVFLSGWNQPPPLDDLRPYRAELRTMFRPRREHCAKAEATIAELRARADHVIGVHIRLGDYRHWLDGRYVFAPADYARAMHALAAQLSGRVAFLVCANEPLDSAAFAGLDTARMVDAAGIEDLYALSLCDYILGPPSTFSMWASFYGDVPLCFLEQADMSVVVSEFSPVVALNRFADGRVFRLREEDEQKLRRLNSAQ